MKNNLLDIQIAINKFYEQMAEHIQWIEKREIYENDFDKLINAEETTNSEVSLKGHNGEEEV